MSTEPQFYYYIAIELLNPLKSNGEQLQLFRGVAKGGPDRAQAYPNVGCALPIKILKSKYCNKTFKYPIKAVKGPDCPANFKIVATQLQLIHLILCMCLHKYIFYLSSQGMLYQMHLQDYQQLMYMMKVLH